MSYRAQEAFRHDFSPDKTVILLVNLGTPTAPTAAAVRKFLGEFLSDPRVIELPRWLWLPILHGVILRIRPGRSARAYQKVWTDDGSPLLVISERQRSALQAVVRDRFGPGIGVELAMRYGNPGIPEVLRDLQQKGLRRLLVLPLYPQYSATTTASIFDAVTSELSQWRWVPELRYVTQYHDEDRYVHALSDAVEQGWREQGRAHRLLFSFHGLPRRYLDNGDPYFCQCHKTARLVAERLQLETSNWAVSFQSRVGRGEWLRPYTDELLTEWGRAGLESVQVVCPGFAADCLETVEEIDMQNRALFTAAGGGQFDYIPALNDDSAHIDALATLVEAKLGDWLPSATTQSDGLQTKARAARLGASY